MSDIKEIISKVNGMQGLKEKTIIALQQLILWFKQKSFNFFLEFAAKLSSYNTIYILRLLVFMPSTPKVALRILIANLQISRVLCKNDKDKGIKQSFQRKYS